MNFPSFSCGTIVRHVAVPSSGSAQSPCRGTLAVGPDSFINPVGTPPREMTKLDPQKLSSAVNPHLPAVPLAFIRLDSMSAVDIEPDFETYQAHGFAFYRDLCWVVMALKGGLFIYLRSLDSRRCRFEENLRNDSVCASHYSQSSAGLWILSDARLLLSPAAVMVNGSR